MRYLCQHCRAFCRDQREDTQAGGWLRGGGGALGGEGALSQSGSGQIDGGTSGLPSGFESSIFMIPNGVLVGGVAVIPLAGWMGRATEHLSARSGPGIGGLLNATFGNAAELIIALMALSNGLIGVVKASITGSIIGNILLVLGAAMVAGEALRQLRA